MKTFDFLKAAAGIATISLCLFAVLLLSGCADKVLKGSPGFYEPWQPPIKIKARDGSIKGYLKCDMAGGTCRITDPSGATKYWIDTP